MSNGINIFKATGSVNWSQIIRQEDEKFQAFITITATGTSNILLGRAPVTGVHIKQLTDFSVTKSLNRDFLVSVFGDTPTDIQLNGISFFNLNGCPLTGTVQSREQVLNFYKRYKLSTDIQNRVDIAIASGTGETPVAFRCVLLGLETKNTSSEDGVGNICYNYSMSLIGVERT